MAIWVQVGIEVEVEVEVDIVGVGEMGVAVRTLAVSSSEVWVFEKTEKGYYLFTVAEDEEEE